jgi:hypothetical protein
VQVRGCHLVADRGGSIRSNDIFDPARSTQGHTRDA